MPLTVGPRRVAPARGSTSITILNAVLAAKDRTTEARQRPPTGYIAVMMGGGLPLAVARITTREREGSAIAVLRAEVRTPPFCWC